jgi:hypothetical protein
MAVSRHRAAGGGGVLLEAPSWRAGLRTGLLLAACVWAFCRLYYFLFYVIERYIDPKFRFAGVWSAVVYVFRRRRGPKA